MEVDHCQLDRQNIAAQFQAWLDQSVPMPNTANVHGRPTIERARINPDGGHTYLITFPMSMGNVPELKVFMTDLPVSISTVEEGN
jgi:hypothetical protein